MYCIIGPPFKSLFMTHQTSLQVSPPKVGQTKVQKNVTTKILYTRNSNVYLKCIFVCFVVLTLILEPIIYLSFFVIRSNIYKHWLCLFSTKQILGCHSIMRLDINSLIWYKYVIRTKPIIHIFFSYWLFRPQIELSSINIFLILFCIPDITRL